MHLHPTNESGRLLYERRIEGPVTMLNLLRFRDVADYRGHPMLAPDEPISGRAAYERYMAHTAPHLESAGGELQFIGSGGAFLIGPLDERWDLVLLVRQPSVDAFMAMASNDAYLAGLGHREAALEDSRLLPIVERGLP